MKQLTLRVPDDLHAALRDLADADHRSMHAKILHILTETTGRQRTDSPPT